MEEFDYKELIKATDNFSSSKLLGKGSHGCVFRASLNNGRQDVAIKKLCLNIEEDNAKKLTNELSIQSSLVHNPHTVKLLGSTRGSAGAHQPLLLVMEFMPNGSLHDSLHISPASPHWTTRFRVLLQLARALESLHERAPPIIHRDVKSTNVMFDAEWNAKLVDFGLAVVKDDLLTCRPAGTIGYLDPWYTCPSKLSTKNDIFSFGVLTLELMSGRRPIDVSKSPSSVVDWAASLIKKQRVMEICDPKIQPLPNCLEAKFCHIIRVAMQCVSPDESCRPSAREVVTELERVPVLERIRILSWVNPIRSIIVLRRQNKWNRRKCSNNEKVDFASGKLLLREILNITLEDSQLVSSYQSCRPSQ